MKGGNDMTQSRWKSKAAWVAVFALLGFFLGNYGLYDAIGLTNESYQMLVNLIFAVISAFGFFNDPTNKTGF
jgi:uncharacterized membrane protein